MDRPRSLVLGSLTFLLAAASLHAQAIQVDFDHGVDFSKYKTFSWSLEQQPASNPANHIRITRAVERELARLEAREFCWEEQTNTLRSIQSHVRT